MFIVPVISQQMITSSNILSETYQNEIAQTDYIPETIRVAIYNEPNMSSPVYDTSAGDNNNNVTFLQEVLESKGYQVTLLDSDDIYNHDLKTADFDVFVLADSNPRENITNLVADYWRNGGSILTFDGSGVFLCWAGILPPEAVGTTGRPTYWNYVANDILINDRHPVSKSYSIDDLIITTPAIYNYLAWDFAVLQATSIGSDLTKIASTSGDSNLATIVAFDPSDRGGKVVTISFDLVHGNVPELNQLYADAVEWLAPSPKGRILFDYLHEPYYGVDADEPSSYNAVGRYSQLRDMWVNHTFTLDKLFPGEADELTLDILAKYDLLFINTPNINYTASEISAIRSWISSGGGLLVLGEFPSFAARNQRINQILSGYDLCISSIQYASSSLITTNSTFHPINEDLVTTRFEGGSYINVTGDATPIWMDSNGFVAGIQDVGNGRIFLASDINFLGNYIDEEDNLEFGLNIANWLCSGGAKILLYTDGASSLGSNYNYYKSPATLALNELRVNYFMSNNRDYFNESLKMYSWDLVIIDANNDAPLSSHSLIIDHLESGGKIIWRDFMFRYSSYDDIWNYLGFAGLDTRITIGPPSVYIWESDHSMFNMPVDYGADNISSSLNLLNTDFTYVSVLDNATALAGISSAYDENQSAIILGVGGRALCNQFSITQYFEDTDDSTYMDNFEMWMNEIAFMLQPTINHPADIEYTEGETGNTIGWIGNSELPFEYNIKMNDSAVTSGSWSGDAINFNVDGLTNGTYVYSITVFDRAGYSISDAVTVIVLPSVTNTTTGGGGLPPNISLFIIIGAAGIIIVVIIVIMVKKKQTK